jgi:Putative transposase.
VFSPILISVEGAEAEGVRFHEATALTDEDIAAVQRAVRTRVLRLFKRRGLLSPEAAAEMRKFRARRWVVMTHFPVRHPDGQPVAVQIGCPTDLSLDATVRIEACNRKGLERLLRYCARPLFAGERLVWAQPGQRLIYQLPKPRPDGQTALSLTPIEFLERLAALIPPPRRHRHRYHGVLAPTAPLRAHVTARAGLPMDHSLDGVPRQASVKRQQAQRPRSSSAYLWAALLARIYEVFPLLCPQCGEPMTIIAFVTEGVSIQRIQRFAFLLRLAVRGTPSLVCPFAGKKVHRTFFSFRLTLEHIGEPTTSPPIAAARGPPDFEADIDQTSVYDSSLAQPAPEYEFDQTISW